MSFRAGGVLGDQADYQTDEELKLIHWECDTAGCAQKTQPMVNQDIARRYAAQAGWSISDEGVFCPKHRDDHEIGPQFEVMEDAEPLTPATTVREVVQRVEVAPPFLLILVSGFMLATFVLLVLLIREHSKRDLAEYSLRGFNQDAFEHRSGIQELSCTSLFDTPRHCSGRMQTEGKPDVPVRYVCDAADCRFEK
jgi:hypothetical protein